jgi:hypothetical protein
VNKEKKVQKETMDKQGKQENQVKFKINIERML